MMTPDAEKLSPEIEKQCSQKCVTGRLATRWRHTTQRRLTPEKNKSLRITQAKLKAVLRGWVIAEAWNYGREPPFGIEQFVI